MERVRRLLLEDGVTLKDGDLRSLTFHLDRSTRRRKLVGQQWAKHRLAQDDIIRLILDARDSGETGEAFWRAFLAAHFGRESAVEVRSATRFLCGFGTSPRWTWKSVQAEPQAFRRWLDTNAELLRTLSYGNHRKYESKKPQGIWETIHSFLVVVREHGDDPAATFTVESLHPDADRFDMLYERLRNLRRFGRAGRFDFLALLSDLGLADVHPRRCYLRGATGPLRGARRLWGDRPVAMLDDLAASLAGRLELSPHVVEDALCNWQKG